MNERVRELAEQAEMAANCGDHVDVTLMMEKFAELIVRECASIYEGVYTDQQRPERIDTRIKQHFGSLRIETKIQHQILTL
jgi:hypothetical protein